jgi:hypothetical protein
MAVNRLDEILRSHAIEPSALRSDDFDRFFAQRTILLLEMLGNAMGKKLTTPRRGRAGLFHFEYNER